MTPPHSAIAGSEMSSHLDDAEIIMLRGGGGGESARDGPHLTV